jgi:hypothetical protein
MVARSCERPTALGTEFKRSNDGTEEDIPGSYPGASEREDDLANFSTNQFIQGVIKGDRRYRLATIKAVCNCSTKWRFYAKPLLAAFSRRIVHRQEG